MLEIVLFLIGSFGILILSRQALTLRYTHGFPRFFAFEALLGLVVLNARNWLFEPFSLPQIVSWALLLDSLALVIHSVYTLRSYGAQSNTIQDSSRLAFEKTTRLVTQGPYKFIRHPMYASLLCLAWGVFLKQINLLSGILAVLVSLTLFLTAVYEERENLSIFGEEYAAYMRNTKRFIPFLF
ncbi:MAG TPA: isoprenylcysteine carboxylmethyltransferase family protein [Anaerolineales bacterium]|nr:isoprenylcysteine carboxylmethyltransferase family protein [Anaerolineales bacterium]